jgi:hypothetical protein
MRIDLRLSIYPDNRIQLRHRHLFGSFHGAGHLLLMLIKIKRPIKLLFNGLSSELKKKIITTQKKRKSLSVAFFFQFKSFKKKKRIILLTQHGGFSTTTTTTTHLLR